MAKAEKMKGDSAVRRAAMAKLTGHTCRHCGKVLSVGELEPIKIQVMGDHGRILKRGMEYQHRGKCP